MSNELYVKQVLDKLNIHNVDEKLRKSLEKAIEKTFNKLETNLSTDVSMTILSILGFNQRWGRDLEIDHCNGRSGNSMIMDELGPILKPIAKDMIHNLVKDIDFKYEMSDERKAAIVHSFKKQYQREVDRAISDKIEYVKSQARKDVDIIFPHIIETLYGKGIDELKADLMIKMLTNDENSSEDDCANSAGR